MGVLVGQNGSKNKDQKHKKFGADLETIWSRFGKKDFLTTIWLADRAEAVEFANLQNLSEFGQGLTQLHPCGGAGFNTLPRTPPGLVFSHGFKGLSYSFLTVSRVKFRFFLV